MYPRVDEPRPPYVLNHALLFTEYIEKFIEYIENIAILVTW